MPIPGLNALIKTVMVGPFFMLETLLNAWQIFHHVLFDIPPENKAHPLIMTAAKNLHIDNLSDPQVIRLTHFIHTQLQDLCHYFDFEGLLDTGEDTLHIYTNYFAGNTPCNYCVHPKEAFLFAMIKIAAGMTN